MKDRPAFLFLALCAASLVAACSGTVYAPPSPPPPPPPSCVAPGCVKLGGGLQAVTLSAVGPVGVTVEVAGRGFISIADSGKPPRASEVLALFDRHAGLSGAIVYLSFTAMGGPATLSRVPGLKLVFSGAVPSGKLRLAALEDGVWTTVGKPGRVSGKTVTFRATRASPPIALKQGDTYELSAYSGAVVTPSPTPSSGPTPTPTPTPVSGALTVTVRCEQSADSCTDGTTASAGSVQFTAIGDDAKLTPSETPASTYTLKSDSCNKADDPSAGGNWASFSPKVGTSAASFKVTAKHAGTGSNPATCGATIVDAKGQGVTIAIKVTLGSIGIH